jgi:hypothetical protein
MQTTMRSGLCACLALAVGLPWVAAQEGQPKPGPEHEMLKKFEGNWDVTVSFAGGESKGTASYKIGLGGFWLQHHFKGAFGDMPFEGRGVTGYDPQKKKYVSTWVDSMVPTLHLFEGSFNKEGTTYTENGEVRGMDGQMHKTKSVHQFKDKDTIVFTMYQIDEGKDEQMMQLTYKRKQK